MSKAYVVIDNKGGLVVGIFPEERFARQMLRLLGNERIHKGEFARFAYEEWLWEEVSKWMRHPGNMGLSGTSLLAS
jgi:hypothetical protein